jgi:hypothetical protein
LAGSRPEIYTGNEKSSFFIVWISAVKDNLIFTSTKVFRKIISSKRNKKKENIAKENIF